MPSLRVTEGIAREQPSRLGRIVVCNRRLEPLALGRRLTQLPAKPAKQADGLLVGRLCHNGSLRREAIS